MPCIQAAIADHFKMFFRDMPGETFDEIHDRQSFLHILVVFMAVIVESDGIPVIPVNSGSGNYRPAKVAADIFCHYFRITKIRFGINIEAMFVLCVTARFHFFERWTDLVFQFIKESGPESVTEIIVIKVLYMAPEAVITVAAFGKETVDVGIPFEIPAESMEDHDITRSIVLGMVQVEKHAGYYTGDRMKETVQEGTVPKEKVAEIFINSKNAMAVLDMDKLERHTGGAFHSIFISAGRTKAAVTAKRNKFEVTAVRAGVHGTAK